MLKVGVTFAMLAGCAGIAGGLVDATAVVATALAVATAGVALVCTSDTGEILGVRPGGALTVIVSDWRTLWQHWLVASTKNVNVPVRVGVPVIMPDGDNISPGGNAPPRSMKWNGGLPVAMIRALYAVPSIASGSVEFKILNKRVTHRTSRTQHLALRLSRSWHLLGIV
jgi:hypothetical protein